MSPLLAHLRPRPCTARESASGVKPDVRQMSVLRRALDQIVGHLLFAGSSSCPWSPANFAHFANRPGCATFQKRQHVRALGIPTLLKRGEVGKVSSREPA